MRRRRYARQWQPNDASPNSLALLRATESRGMTATSWPDDLLRARAPTIGPALQQLIDNEPRWIHRRVERIELTSTTQLVRTVEADLTVPPGLAGDLRYIDSAADRFIIPLGVLPKAPLIDFALEPKEVERLTADQANLLVVAALAPLTERADASLEQVLRLLRVIVRDERPGGASGSAQYRQLAQSCSVNRGTTHRSASYSTERTSLTPTTCCWVSSRQPQAYRPESATRTARRCARRLAASTALR